MDNTQLDPEFTPAPDDSQEEKDKKLSASFRARIDTCKTYRRKLIQGWTTNIDYRRGKPFASQTDEDRVVVNLDWPMTKAKQAALFSQVPQIHIDHPPQTLQGGSWMMAFEQKINDTMIAAGIESAMDECMADTINAAGIGAVIVSHEALTQNVQVPRFNISSLPPQFQQTILTTGKMPDGSEIPMETVPNTVDHRYIIQRISPADLLWPISFNGSDFDNAPWIGRSGRMPWEQAAAAFNLTEADREKVLGDDRTTLDRMTHDLDKDKTSYDDQVSFDEIFYKEFHYIPNPRSFNSIRRMVFLHGKEEPVIHEPWNGQDTDKNSGALIGSLKYPIRTCTLTYITDETIPPSDTAIGRPQVNEINRGRTQMIMQRERSLPMVWGNVNGLDPLVLQGLMRGTWQNLIPVQGDGSRYLGAVPRSPIPPENFNFDMIAKADLSNAMGLGENQMSNYAPGKKSATEAGAVQQNYQARIGRERAKVGKFFVSIAEVLGGLISLYESADTFGEGFDPNISRALSFSILADSTVLLDSNQRLERLIKFLNFTAKSGWVNLEPVLKEIATLSGLDPNIVIQAPQPQPPSQPNISLRLTGVQDLLNPMTLATLMKTGQAPEPQMIEDAKKLIQLVVLPPTPPQPSGPGVPGGPVEGNPNEPQGPPTGPPDPNAPPPANLEPGTALPPGMAHQGGPPTVPQPPPPGVGEANPRYSYNTPIQKRTEGDEA